MRIRAVAAAAVLVAGCGDNLAGPAGDDGGDDVPPEVDLATCASWTATPPAALTALDNEQSMFPTLAALDDGWAVAWYDGRSGNDIYYARLDRNGGRLTDDVLVTTETELAGNPRIAVRETELGIAYESFRDLNPEIVIARIDRDGTRLAEARASSTPESSTRPAIAATDDGWAAVWVETSAGVPTNEEVWLARWVDGDATTADPIRITDAPGSSYAPSVAASADQVRVAWHDRRDDQADVYTASTADVSVEIPLAITDADSLVPEITDGDGGWAVAYHDNREGYWQSYLTRTDASGGAIGETRVSNLEYDATFPRAVWVGGVWVVSWSEHVDVDDDRILAVRVSRDGALIGEPIEVVHDPRAMYGAIAASASGEIGVVWHDASANVELGFARVVCND